MQDIGLGEVSLERFLGHTVELLEIVVQVIFVLASSDGSFAATLLGAS